VPFGYLVTVAVVAWCTFFALVPLPRPRVLGVLSWSSSLVVNELPFVACYWLLAWTLLAFGQHDLGSPGGLAVLGLAVLTTAGLAVVARRGFQAGPAVERALGEGLGTGWRTTIDQRMASTLRHHPPFARFLFAPFFASRRRVRRVANISYGDAGKLNLLDLYSRRGQASDGPVLVYLHGGSFARGSKNREARPLLYRLASQGWTCISANYRLSPAARFPDHLIDVKKVIAWVREHGREYGADPATIFIAGSSAGGHLASMAALTPGDPAFQPGFEPADTSVTAAISLYGFYGSLDTAHQLPSSPAAYAGPHAPPFFLAHGDHDTFVPVEGARLFARRLRASSSNPVVYAELPGAQHSFDLFPSPRFVAVVDAIESFAAWVRSRDLGSDNGAR
jgi:acetyl esterase/lipase